MRSLKVLSLALLTVVGAGMLAACGGATPVVPGATQPAAAQTKAAPAPAAGSVSLTGAGATFPAPVYQKWFYDYAFVDTSAKFNYQAIGSGGGIKAITDKTADFAGSDAILNADQKKAAPDVLMFPTVAGAVTISYNVQDADKKAVPAGLKLDGPTIVAIFLGKITKWNDPALTKLNPDIKLPDADIVVAHRSDGSGTTFLFTNYLSQVSDDWKNGPGAGTSVKWPVGLGGRGNAGVAGIVKDQPNSLGYVDIADAKSNNLTYANVQNSAGSFVEPTIDSIVAAAAAFAGQMPDDMGQLIVNTSAKDGYPITGYTFLLLYKDMPDCAKASALVRFYRWALDKGSDDAKALNYAPLSDEVRKAVETRLGTLTCGGGKPIEGNK